MSNVVLHPNLTHAAALKLCQRYDMEATEDADGFFRLEPREGPLKPEPQQQPTTPEAA